MDYWNNIDADLELEMDVFDDVAGEGKEVTRYALCQGRHTVIN